ncbi:MAG: hypothetical protein B7733_04565 [Myxococcales bacterium FL481]|nr:MAG: hypothetical protein B7733_04565 [Myxococcales bacterium FL481]
MVRKRPCRICKRWFQPNPRVGDRQKVCSNATCQRERHRRACAEWRRRNPDYDREERLRRKLRHDDDAGSSSAPDRGAHAAKRGLRLAAVRDEMGLQAYVLIDEIAGLLRLETRDGVVLQPPVIAREFGTLSRRSVQDEFVSGAGPP